MIIIFLLATFLCASGNEDHKTKEAESRIDAYLKPSEQVILQKPNKKDEQKSFMSRLASWLFPFGGNDDTISAEGQSRAQYAPPPPSHQDKQCSPCNSVPWVPIVSNRGAHTLLEFKPPQYLPQPTPSSHNFQNFKVSQPQQTYGPPQEPTGHYSPPPIPLTNYGSPPAVLPLTLQSNFAQHQTDEYGPPPPLIPAGHDQFISASQHNPQKEQHYHKPKLSNFKQPTKPYKFIPVKFMQFPKLELGPKPPNQGPPVTFRPLPQQQKITDNFAAPATFIIPPPLQFTAAPPVYFDSNVRGPIIPLPNLNLKPALPIHNYQNFKSGFSRPFNDNLPQQAAYIPVNVNNNHHEVEIQPSIPVAGYLASIEHPINVIQSPIVEVTVKEQSAVANEQTAESSTLRLEDTTVKTDFKNNPIVVPESDDAHFAETTNNQTTHNIFNVNNKRGNDNNLGIFSFNKESPVFKENEDLIKQILQTTYAPKENHTEFTSPPIDYTSWTPSYKESPSDKMTPPFESPSPWTNYISSSPTTKKPKQIQVIIPYITNQKPTPFNNQQSPSDSLSMYFTPPSKSPVWPEYLEQESQKVFTAHKATNIKELLKSEIDSKQQPFDILTLQKTIDDWTQQEFSNKLSIRDETKLTTSSKLVPSKNIPNNFFTSSTTPAVSHYDDHSAAGSIQRETKIKKDVADFESNLITLDGSTEKPSTEFATSTLKESLYIVTAKPWSVENDESVQANITHKTATFAIRLESDNDTLNSNKTEKVIYSEWPHLSKLLLKF